MSLSTMGFEGGPVSIDLVHDEPGDIIGPAMAVEDHVAVLSAHTCSVRPASRSATVSSLPGKAVNSAISTTGTVDWGMMGSIPRVSPLETIYDAARMILRMSAMQPSRDISRLIEIMAALRDPTSGCPWDLEQDFSTIRHYTIEEAYEVADAIERQDFHDLKEELGDLLLQPIFHAQMAKEAGHFDIGDVIHAITEKLIRRHPHVFGDIVADDAAGAQVSWEAIKSQERAAKAARRGGDTPVSALDDVPQVLPALARAEKLTKKAAKVGFDWPDFASVMAKVEEEIAEAAEAQGAGDAEAMHEEIGDLLFAVANLARHAGVDAEAALRDANAKFTRRFHYVEDRCRQDGIEPAAAGLDRLDGYWNEIRAADKEA